MVKIYSDFIVVTKNDPSYFPLSIYLKSKIPSKRIVTKRRTINIEEEVVPLYTLDEDFMYIPRGLLFFIERYISGSDVYYVDNKSPICDVDKVINNLEDYRNILDGITLRDVQLEALKRGLINKRCIIQMGTGAGKSEVMCSIIKCLGELNNYNIPTTLVMEPTVRLKLDMIERFRKYDIPTVDYSDKREIVPNCVNICHPQSLGNDLNIDPNILNSVEVLFGDEGHHMKSESWRSPTRKMKNLIYSIVVSASAIDQEHVGKKEISEYSYGELLVIGASGPLVYNVAAGSLIDRGNLAKPVLIMLDNPADEKLDNYKKDFLNWNEVSKIRLQSSYRTGLVASSAEFFHNKNRKSLILVHTRKWAYEIMKVLHDKGLSENSRCSFGGGSFQRYNGYEFEEDKTDVFERFKTGDISILIGTSHLYEGVDIPNLDALILAYGGKAERLQLQGVGRVLRKTKTGNRAYIIDFNDKKDAVLSAQSRKRMKRYQEIIGIDEKDIYEDMQIENLENIFNIYED